MIFLTLGTQLPFDRLVEAMDMAAGQMSEDVIAQVGASTFQAQHMKCIPYLSPPVYSETFARARVIVGHAGMGTILQATKLQKPLIVMARRADLEEHRNDHQAATVAHVSNMTGLYVVETAEDIVRLLQKPQLEPMSAGPTAERDRLIDRLRQEIFGEAKQDVKARGKG